MSVAPPRLSPRPETASLPPSTHAVSKTVSSPEGGYRVKRRPRPRQIAGPVIAWPAQRLCQERSGPSDPGARPVSLLMDKGRGRPPPATQEGAVLVAYPHKPRPHDDLSREPVTAFRRPATHSEHLRAYSRP